MCIFFKETISLFLQIVSSNLILHLVFFFVYNTFLAQFIVKYTFVDNSSYLNQPYISVPSEFQMFSTKYVSRSMAVSCTSPCSYLSYIIMFFGWISIRPRHHRVLTYMTYPFFQRSSSCAYQALPKLVLASRLHLYLSRETIGSDVARFITHCVQ